MYNEKEILLDFKQYAPNYDINYDFVFDCDKVLCDMQHYMIPTRLLDWSLSPLVALFFACYDTNNDLTKNGRVYILDPWSYYKQSKVVDYSIADNHQIQILARALLAYNWSNKDKDIFDYLSKRYPNVQIDQDKIELPMPYVSAFTNKRKLSQNGVFLIWGRDKSPLESMCEVKPYIQYIDIKESEKSNLLNELNRLFINEYAVYPDFDGMSKMIKSRGSLFNLNKKECKHG
jgi:hypothetical protein